MRRTTAIMAIERERSIAFRPAYYRLTGNVITALFLQQAVYETCREANDVTDGWFRCTREQWLENTCLSVDQQEAARKKLTDMKVLYERREGVSTVKWFRVDMDALDKTLTELIQHPRSESGKSRVGSRENPASLTREESRLTESGLINRDKEGDIVDAYASTCLTDTAVNNFSITRNQESSRTREKGTALSKRPRASTALPDDTAPAPKNASAMYIDAYREATRQGFYPGVTPTLGPRHHKQLKDYATTCGEPEGFSRALQGFFGDQWARGANFTVSALCSRQPDGWWGTVQQKSNGPQSDEDLMAITERALQQKWPWEK